MFRTGKLFLQNMEMIELVGVTKFGFEKTLEFMYKGRMSKLASINLPQFQEIMKAADVLNSSKVSFVRSNCLCNYCALSIQCHQANL